MNYSDYKLLVEKANRLSSLYYVNGNSPISDADFDAIVKQIESYETAHPDAISPISPTQTVGSDLTPEAEEVDHSIPMLSQQKAHSIEEIERFVERFVERFAQSASPMGDGSFHVEWKLDGISCSLVYIDGRLTSAATRGDGRKGRNIMRHVRLMSSVPSTIAASGRVEVRGEIVCANGHHCLLGFKDERTAAAAICNSSYSASAKSLYFLAWESIADGIDSFSTAFDRLAGLGFLTVPAYESCAAADLPRLIEESVEARSGLAWPTDGLVIKVNSLAAYHAAGFTAHHPKGSIAYKFETIEAITNINSIEIKVGKSGRRTPVAHVNPVEISGRTISRVNLFSEKCMNELGAKDGSLVRVSLQNGVTPKIIGLVAESEAPEAPAHPEASGSILPEPAPTEKQPRRGRFDALFSMASVALKAVAVVACLAVALFILPVVNGAFSK